MIGKINSRIGRALFLLASLNLASACGTNSNASVRLSREAAQTWGSAAREVLTGTCGIPSPTDRQLSQAEEALRNRNPNCSLPIDCDPRIYNKLRSDVEVALPTPLASICAFETRVEQVEQRPPVEPRDAGSDVPPPPNPTAPDADTAAPDARPQEDVPDTAAPDTAVAPETTVRPPRDGGRRPPRPRDTGTPVIPLP